MTEERSRAEIIKEANALLDEAKLIRELATERDRAQREPSVPYEYQQGRGAGNILATMFSFVVIVAILGAVAFGIYYLANCTSAFGMTFC